jgi:hypothetical protein
MGVELPPELKLVEPLLNDMGYEWSTHIRLDDGRVWAVVNSSTNKAGRVAMSVAEAQEHVIAMARVCLRRLKQNQEQTRKTLVQLIEEQG